jgi:hypothetical protein
MSALAVNYIYNPFTGFFKGLLVMFEIVGYSRAAAHLSSLGYHKEAKNCMMQVKQLKSRQVEVNSNLKGWV